MSLPTPPPTFTPSLFARPIALLSTLLSSSSDGQPSAKEVYAELEKVKLWLCAGLSVPAKKESEKKEVESGTFPLCTPSFEPSLPSPLNPIHPAYP